ncbi:MAG: phosphatidate cytidylyltransferase, partial [bacterium]
GKNPFFNNISPSKTIEGYFGGAIFSSIIGFLIALYTGIFELGKIKIILIILSIAILSAFGDIFESLIKRISNVKESGNIIPGHGGVLDRTDSLVFSIYLSSIIYFIIPS